MSDRGQRKAEGGLYAHADITSVHPTIADDVIYMQIYTAAKIARLPVALGRQ